MKEEDTHQVHVFAKLLPTSIPHTNIRYLAKNIVTLLKIKYPMMNPQTRLTPYHTLMGYNKPTFIY